MAAAGGAVPALGLRAPGQYPARGLPGKPGLELSAGLKVRMRAAAERRKASAPENRGVARATSSAARSATNADKCTRRACLHGGHGWMRLSALRSPRLFVCERLSFLDRLGGGKPRTRFAPRERFGSSLRAKQFSSRAALYSFAAFAPRSDKDAGAWNRFKEGAPYP
jgi:hypothetical protein